MAEPDLARLILEKVYSIPLNAILWGKELVNNQLIEITERQYEFDLNPDSRTYMLLRLFIQHPQRYFTSPHAQTLEIHPLTKFQIVPFTYDTLSKLTYQELEIIWQDFD